MNTCSSTEEKAQQWTALDELCLFNMQQRRAAVMQKRKAAVEALIISTKLSACSQAEMLDVLIEYAADFRAVLYGFDHRVV